MPRYYYNDEDYQHEKRKGKRSHEEECPYCEERRFYKEPDYYEKPKKRRCDEDRFDHPEKCWYPPMPDWFKCPPPWFWCKPEQEEKKECKKREDCDCDRKDDCKRKDDCDKRDDCDRKDDECKKHKENFGELEAFGYVYSLTATNATIAPNNDFVFTNNGPLKCVSHTPNTSQVFIRKSGAYEIYYGIFTTTGAGTSFSLAVNGVVDPATTIPLSGSPGEFSGKVIQNLRAGDFLTLRNTSATQTITLAASPNIGAQLTLERVGCIDFDRGFDS